MSVAAERPRKPWEPEHLPISRVYACVHDERRRAHRKHDRADHGSMERKAWDHPVWLPVLTEEVGEVARVLCEDELGTEPRARERLREELVQVAAMACAWVDAIDGGGLR